MFGKLKSFIAGIFANMVKAIKARRTNHELEFLPAAVEVMATPPPWLARSIVWFILFVFLFGATWAAMSSVEQIISAQGKVIPSGQSKVIRAYDRAIVEELMVLEGGFVEVSETLVVFESTESEVDYKQLLANISISKKVLLQSRYFLGLLKTLESSKNLFKDALEFEDLYKKQVPKDYQLTDSGRELLNNLGSFVSVQMDVYLEINDLKERLAQLHTESENLSKMHELHRKKLSRFRSLHRKRLVSDQALEDVEAVFFESQNKIKQNDNSKTFAQEKIQNLEEKLSLNFFNARTQELEKNAEAKKEFASQQVELERYLQRLKTLRLVAPIAGYVFNLNISSNGASVQPGEELMTIVPQGNLKIEAMVLNRDVGYVNMGDVVQIKLESFEYTRYGFAKGKILDVSADAIAHEQLGNVYKVYIEIVENHIRQAGKTVEILPGMNATIEINQGNRTLLEYFLNPLLKDVKEAFRERS